METRMTRSTRAALGLVLAVAVALGGCQATSKLYCEKHPDDRANCSGAGDGGPDTPSAHCTSAAACTMAGLTACDLGSDGGTCVQCIDDTTCGTTAPACGSDDTCHACTKNADCLGSEMCLDDGSCADVAQVAYLDGGALTNGDCTKAAPCNIAQDALATQLPFIHVAGTNRTSQLAVARSVTLIGDGSSSELAGTDPVTLELQSGTIVIAGLTIRNTLLGGVGVSVPTNKTPDVTLERCVITKNGGGGIVAANGTMTIERCNIFGNAAGGMSLGSQLAAMQVTVINNFITGNGNPTGGVGGALINPAAGSKFQFNTVVDNRVKTMTAPTNAGGLNCLGTLTADNNLFARNFAANVASPATNVVGCDPGTSVLEGMTITDLALLDPEGVNHADPDYHLTVASAPAIDKAAGTTVSVDVDGDARPNGSAADLGADEFTPP